MPGINEHGMEEDMKRVRRSIGSALLDKKVASEVFRFSTVLAGQPLTILNKYYYMNGQTKIKIWNSFVFYNQLPEGIIGWSQIQEMFPTVHIAGRVRNLLGVQLLERVGTASYRKIETDEQTCLKNLILQD